MRRLTPGRWYAVALLTTALLSAALETAEGQGPPTAPVPGTTPSVGTGIVKGTVVTDQRVPVGGAQIRFGTVAGVAESDESGQFSASRITPGRLWLRVRRIGYRPESLLVVVG
ncbi:MAG: carboxypeptidase-like regulatory domain-containing protein, partial [Gemmatimonadota bacterium]|nr:carboxypeptidase-like regulatory domain-containing protein [Gemmatimonadota bacterium]